MPRQKQTAPSKRRPFVTFRVSNLEDAEITARARAARLSFSDYARHLLICGPIETREREVLDPLAVLQLMRIGVNLGQLLALPDAARVHDAVSQLKARVSPIVEEAIDAEFSDDDAEPEDRTKMRRVRVSEQQQHVIKALAKGSGKSVSDYAREMLTGGRVVIRQIHEQAFPHFDELRDLGGFLNSKTHKGNAKGKTPRGLPPVLGRIHEILDAAR